MATKIIHKKSSVADRIPLSTDLEAGELALNLADRKIYSKQTDGTVIEMAPNIDQLALTEPCKNVSGGTLAAGTPVYQSGTAGNAMEVQAARADNASTMPAIGVITTALDDEEEGTLVLTGFIQHLNTSGYLEGETLYVSPTGGFTNTPPAGSGNLIQNIGKVIKVHSSNGSIMVTGAGRANATPNLDDGDIFIGNSSNKSVTGSLDTLVGNEGYVKSLTLQEVYEASATNPEITTDSTQGALQLRRGSAADTDTVFEIQNSLGDVKASITGAGVLSATELQINGSAIDLDDLDGVTVGTPGIGHVLSWDDNTSQWVSAPVPQGVTTSLSSFTLGPSTAEGWTIGEFSGNLRFVFGVTAVASLSSTGELSLANDLISNTTVDGPTETQGASEWNYHNDSTNIYFQYGSNNVARLFSDGSLFFEGDLYMNATISGTVSSSFYLRAAGIPVMEITSSGDVYVASSVNTDATIS